MSIEDRIEREERALRETASREAAAHDAWANAQPRHVSLERLSSDTQQLTIHGVTWRPSTGWLLVFAAALLFMLGLAEQVLVLVGLAVLVPGVALIASPRSTVRIVATPAGFAVYLLGAEPSYVGRHIQLDVDRYEWRGAHGVSVRANGTRHWQQTYMRIAHPEDLRAIAAFNALRRPQSCA